MGDQKTSTMLDETESKTMHTNKEGGQYHFYCNHLLCEFKSSLHYFVSFKVLLVQCDVAEAFIVSNISKHVNMQ